MTSLLIIGVLLGNLGLVSDGKCFVYLLIIKFDAGLEKNVKIQLYIYVGWIVEYAGCISTESKDSFPVSVRGLLINCIFSLGVLGNVKYSTFAITPRSTLTCIGSTC